MVLKVLKLYAIIQGDTPWSTPTFKGREEDWEALKETEKKRKVEKKQGNVVLQIIYCRTWIKMQFF